MEKSVFNKITKEVFLEYGFKKEGSSYVLLLDEISIVVRFSSWRGIKYFGYNFAIHDLYDSSVPYVKRYDSLVEIKMEHTPSHWGYESHEIRSEEYDETEYRELLSNLLHRCFDRYQKDALQSLRENNFGMILRKEVLQYLGFE